MFYSVDYSLMNPKHIAQEIRDLENILIPEHEALAKKLNDDVQRIIDYVTPTHNQGQPTTLTTEQVSDLFGVLWDVRMQSWRYSRADKFALRVYKYLMTDRRWIIGSKLKFLRPKK